jgi:hypothetical protein
MERWAATTLRAVGILLSAVFTIVASLILLLLSLCFAGHGTPITSNVQSMGFLVAAVLVLILGIFTIARLARAIIRSGSTEATQPPQPQTNNLPLRISPDSEEALNHLSYAIGASIGLGVLAWGTALYRLQGTRGAGQSGGYYYQQPWLIVALVTAVFQYLPSVLLLFRLQQKPDRPTLAFSIAIPAANILHTITAILPLMWRMLSSPIAFVPTLLPMAAALVLQIAIVYLAWRANQRLGYHHESISLIVAGAAAYVYFIIFGSANAWMYRFIR